MKARVISTREIVDVIAVDIDDTLSVITRYIYKEIDGAREWYDHELYFDVQEDEKPIDWEQRRFELVKAALQGFLSNPDNTCVEAGNKLIAEWSVSYADAVISKLKES